MTLTALCSLSVMIATLLTELLRRLSSLILAPLFIWAIMTIIWRKAELEALREEKATEQSPLSLSQSTNYQLQKETQKEARKLARRLEQLEAEIEELETQTTELTTAMQETNDASELMEFQQKLDQLTERQEAAMTEWGEVAEQVERSHFKSRKFIRSGEIPSMRVNLERSKWG